VKPLVDKQKTGWNDYGSDTMSRRLRDECLALAEPQWWRSWCLYMQCTRAPVPDYRRALLLV
jgi:hypothetical protein